ncbi:VWA domain-containing protein [Ottowia sp. GY511]|uniref:VIT domain-containing protein n=1 Tax=Ottowia flava TaxID=2675430 RepID=A0ABW4KZG5_9BURK|nr:VIT domain-containing protein [Ottowia sp. GY511]TXK28561.1 VWA domain-containing protein [Ottowia sp. GY511]
MRHFPLPDASAVLRALPELAPRLPVPEPLRCTLEGALHTGRQASVCLQRASWYVLLLGLVALAPSVHAQDGSTAPAKAESPYFFVKGAQPGVDALPLKSTDVQVNISGVIADVVVTQRYKNEGTVPIEAKYLFPGSTRAAVNGLNVRIGERLIAAKIREKQQAQVEYNAAKKEGKTAALLEQHRPNVFQMNVANILPGDDVQVELRYNELLVPTDGKYQFVFPTVVGPRYAGMSKEPPRSPAAQGALPPEGTIAALGRPGGGGNAPTEASSGQALQRAAGFPAQPVLHQGEVSPSAFNLKVNLASPIGIQEIRSPSHAIDTQIDADSAAKQASVRLADTSSRGVKGSNNRDFILDYRLSGNGIQTGVLLHKGEKENFFLAMVQPPKAVALKDIPPRDYIFVVDISGSMHGFPLETSKALLRELIGNLRASDTFNVMLFSGSNQFLSPQSVPATSANINAAIATIEKMGGSGSTELLPALRRVYQAPKDPAVSRSIVVVTDGYVTVESEAFALVRKHLGQANLFSFGIGGSVNRHLMEGLARAGMGEPFIITRPDEAEAQAKRFRQIIATPVLTQVKARFEGLDVYDVEPEQLPDVLAERPVIVFGKWRESATGAAQKPQLIVEGLTPGGAYRQALPIDTQASWSGTGALRHLWARHRIAALSDQEALTGGEEQKAAITRLGLDYSLLTQYTSFIAVDKVVRNPGGNQATANQPSPLPEGVTDRAVGDASALGAAVGSTPEPATWAAMLVVLAVLGGAVARRRTDRFTA